MLMKYDREWTNTWASAFIVIAAAAALFLSLFLVGSANATTQISANPLPTLVQTQKYTIEASVFCQTPTAPLEYMKTGGVSPEAQADCVVLPFNLPVILEAVGPFAKVGDEIQAAVRVTIVDEGQEITAYTISSFSVEEWNLIQEVYENGQEARL